jgi:hypothetical protein
LPIHTAAHRLGREELTTPYPPPPPGSPAPTPGGQQNNTFGLLALILGIVSIPLVCCLYLGVPVGIAAVVLGFLGKQKADQGLANNRGMAIAGMICGAAAVVFAVLSLIAFFAFDWNFGYRY